MGWDGGRDQKVQLAPFFAVGTEGRIAGNDGTLGVIWGDHVLPRVVLDREKEQPCLHFKAMS